MLIKRSVVLCHHLYILIFVMKSCKRGVEIEHKSMSALGKYSRQTFYLMKLKFCLRSTSTPSGQEVDRAYRLFYASRGPHGTTTIILRDHNKYCHENISHPNPCIDCVTPFIFALGIWVPQSVEEREAGMTLSVLASKWGAEINLHANQSASEIRPRSGGYETINEAVTLWL